jgi:opacity protein-like surface antigen
MRRVIVLAIFLACSASVGFGQSSTDAKVEGFAGFSIDSIDTGLASAGFTTNGNRTTGLGFDTSVTGFLNKRFGIEGNVDGHFKTKTFNIITCQALGCPPPSFTARISSFNFMGGPHVRFQTANSKVTPYVHALAGGNHSRASSNVLTGADSETDFALKLGGGVDFGLTTRTGVRLSADYNPIFQKSNGNLNPNFGSGRTRNDAVFSIGIVFK